MVDLKAEAAAIRAVETKGLAAMRAKDLDAIAATYMASAIVMPPNAPAIRGSAAIRRFWEAWFATPGFAVGESDWVVDVAKSGDFAYMTGKYTFTSKDASGRKTTDDGKFVDVWKKQPRTGWKHALSMFSSDMPAAAGDGTPSQADRDAVQKAGDEYVAAFNAGDLNRWMKTVTDDVEWLPPDAPAVKGKAAVRAFVKKNYFDPVRYNEKYSIDELEVYGSFAYTLCSIWGDVTPRGGGEKVAFRGKVLSTWRRGTDGSWKVAMNMFNSDAPLPAGSTPSEADAAGIVAVVQEYMDAIEAGDLARWVKVNTDDALYMAPDQPRVQGKAAIRKWAKEGWFDPFTMKYDYVRLQELAVAGDWGVGWYELRIGATPKGGGKQIKGTGKTEILFRKQANGSWKYARQIFNWDKPLGAA